MSSRVPDVIVIIVIMTTMTVTMTMMLLACPSAFTYHSESNICLKIVTTTATWTSAAARCLHLDQRAHLVVINDNDKQTAVKNSLQSLSGKSVPK